MVFSTIQTWLDKIPLLMDGIRGVLIKIIGFIGLSEEPAFMLVAWVIAIFLAFMWFKRWVAVSIFSRLSILLNFILFALLIYVVLVYV